jgi:hypothetical protein
MSVSPPSPPSPPTVHELLKLIARSSIDLLINRRLLAQELHAQGKHNLFFTATTRESYRELLRENNGSGCMLNACMLFDLFTWTAPHIQQQLPSVTVWTHWTFLCQILEPSTPGRFDEVPAPMSNWLKVSRTHRTIRGIQSAFAETKDSPVPLIHLVAVNDPGSAGLHVLHKFGHAWIVIQQSGVYHLVQALGRVFTLADWVGVEDSLGGTLSGGRREASRCPYRGIEMNWDQMNGFLQALALLAVIPVWNEGTETILQLLGYRIQGREYGRELASVYPVDDGTTQRFTVDDCFVYDRAEWDPVQVRVNVQWLLRRERGRSD